MATCDFNDAINGIIIKTLLSNHNKCVNDLIITSYDYMTCIVKKKKHLSSTAFELVWSTEHGGKY